MDNKQSKILIESGLGLGALGGILTLLSPCCWLPALFALLASLGISATVIKSTGSVLLGISVIVLIIGVTIFIKNRNKNKESCCSKVNSGNN